MQDTNLLDSSHGLHERAIGAFLEMVAASHPILPPLDDVAQTIDVPPERLQELFADNRALLFASLEQAMIMLMDGSRCAVVKVDPDNPMAQFVALSNAYLDWADRHRVAFRLLTDSDYTMVLNAPGLRRYVDAIIELMTRMMSRARDLGLLHPREDIPMLVLSSRSFAFGLARMLVDGHMARSAPGRDPLVTAKMLSADFVTRISRSSKAPSAA